MWLVYIVLLIAFIFILDKLLVDPRLLELAEKFNGPKRYPIIGTAYSYFGLKPDGEIKCVDGLSQSAQLNVKCAKIALIELYGFMKIKVEKYARTGHKIFRSWVGNNLEIMVDDPKHLEVILTNNKFLSKSSQYSFLHDSLGEGLLFSTNQKWFTRRRIITPTFHFKILEQFFEVFVEQNQLLMDKIGEKADGQIFDIFPLITASVMNTIIETAMGCKIKAEDFEYLQAVKDLGYLVSTRFVTPWQRIQFLYDLTSNKRKVVKYTKIMNKFTTKIITQRRALVEKENNENLINLDDDDVGLKKKMCLLDVLLQSSVDGKPLSNQDIQEEVDTFTFAGHDTTTNAICFTLFVISKHPEVQRKLNEEIQQLIGDEDVSFKSINEFKYLDIVIKETLRLYPPAPIISRRLHEEVDFGDFIAPANANYNLVLYTMFRNPELFENPDDFIPERFLNSDRSPYAFIPFSAGSRNCIGQKFALLNIKNNIINILRRFEIVPGNIEPKVEINLTLKCDGISIGFKAKQK